MTQALNPIFIATRPLPDDSEPTPWKDAPTQAPRGLRHALRSVWNTASTCFRSQHIKRAYRIDERNASLSHAVELKLMARHRVSDKSLGKIESIAIRDRLRACGNDTQLRRVRDELTAAIERCKNHPQGAALGASLIQTRLERQHAYFQRRYPHVQAP